MRSRTNITSRLPAMAITAGLVLGSAAPAQATFPGKNGRIAFDSNRSGNAEVYTMKPNGRDVRQLTNDPAQDSAPNWSPDGRRLLFLSRRDGSLEIYVMDADGGNQVRLTNDPALDSRADWSPDGRRIVFVSTRDGGVHPITGLPIRRVYVMNADGSGVHRLTNPVQDLDNGPHFSPDGRKIAFLRVQANGRMAVFTIDADGTGERKLTPDSLNGAEPDWSPDGRRIAFQNHTCPLAECAVESDILVMDSDGSDVRELTHNFAGATGDNFLQPRWSPDGRRITFHEVTSSGVAFDVWTMTAKGRSLRSLTESPDVHDASPAWGPGREKR